MEDTAPLAGTPDAGRPWPNGDLSPDEHVQRLRAAMTLEEKLALLSEHGGFASAGARLGLPILKMADGPAGIRIPPSEGYATALPAPIALAATWDLDVAHRYGDVIGREAQACGLNVLFGPCL